ncbi:ubiquitin-protein ligase [Lithospermum erythrorhizon]|uniref:Ubiquitin-protein ligase n=1 Tax=Lithospermum erythrorhizon TaxID=34254 RepID=A0AAV3NYR2_LITER
MSFFPSLTSPPPPPPPPPPSFFTTENGGTSATNQPQPYNYNTINNAGLITSTSSSSSSSPSFTSSIVITSIVISSAIIISASIYILLRFLSRRSPFTSADDVVSPPSSNHHHNNNNNYYHTVQNSLPVFTFGSLNGNLTGRDCAVCLSKFKRKETLRLLPLCCHAFHTQCIDAWLLSNQTCPLCRSTVYPTDTDLLNKILSVNENTNENSFIGVNSSSNGSSFRVEIGSISSCRRGPLHEGIEGEGTRSYSLGSFEYIVDEGYEIPMDSIYMRGALDVGLIDNKEVGSSGVSMEAPRPDILDGEVGGSGRNWLREYVDRLSSRAVSFRSSGRFFSGSSRRNDVVVPMDVDLEAINSHGGEDTSELFRWISGV